MFEVSVLGPIEVRRDGEVVAVPAGKTSELLVRLALDAGVFVRTDRLVDDLWGDGAVDTRRNTLQSKVAKLRRALGDPSVILTGDGGYQMAVEPSTVDALVVLDRTAEVARLVQAGDGEAAAELCRSTLGRYRGDLLPGAGTGDWVHPQRARLEAARITLLETDLSTRLALGDPGAVIGDLETAVSTAPFQEGLWELLITALYRAGRQAEALATYQRVRQLLAEELGLDPGPPLQDLERQILLHEVSPGSASDGMQQLEKPTGPVATASPPDGNLPSMSAELIGREPELAAVCDLLAGHRLVEIVGPGGIGKTALAIEVGRRMRASGGVGADGVWLARLETATTADDVADTLIAALNVSGGEAALIDRLKGRAALLILDNCEHVVEAAAALVLRLLDAVQTLTIVCTSQVALEVEAERIFELAPLALDDAVELFTRRATAQRTRQRVSGTDDAIHDLCRSLDGLPLAIELAAARTRTLSIEDITRRLDDRFSVLSDPTSRRPERRRALRATIRWSYELLFPDDQRGLWALATFAGGASLAAVEFVLDALDVPAATAIDVVGRLASRSLVIVDDDAGGGGGERSGAAEVRYRLLDSIRAFALESMGEAGLTERAFAAHTAWFAAAAATSTTGVRSSRQADHLGFARTERANIDVALGWAAAHDPQRALEIVNGYGWAWVVLGDSRGAPRLLAALDAAGTEAPTGARAGALLLAAWIEASTDHLELAREHIAAAEQLADSINDVALQARCCYYLAYVVSHEGDFRRAIELTDRSRDLYRGRDLPWDQVANELFAARAAISAGDIERSIEARDRIEHLLSMVDDPWMHVRREAMLGELARVEHRFDDAVLHIGRAAETSGRLGFLQTEAYQVSSLGRAQCQAGDYVTGAITLQLAVDKAEATGDVRMAALARVHLGRVLRAIGDTDGARTALEAATSWHRAAGGGEQAALGECLLAALDALDATERQDDVAAAVVRERLAAILDQASVEDQAHVEVFALDALARLAAAAGDTSTARDLGERADRRMAAAAHFITELDRTDARAVSRTG